MHEHSNSIVVLRVCFLIEFVSNPSAPPQVPLGRTPEHELLTEGRPTRVVGTGLLACLTSRWQPPVIEHVEITHSGTTGQILPTIFEIFRTWIFENFFGYASICTKVASDPQKAQKAQKAQRVIAPIYFGNSNTVVAFSDNPGGLNDGIGISKFLWG